MGLFNWKKNKPTLHISFKNNEVVMKEIVSQTNVQNGFKNSMMNDMKLKEEKTNRDQMFIHLLRCFPEDEYSEEDRLYLLKMEFEDVKDSLRTRKNPIPSDEDVWWRLYINKRKQFMKDRKWINYKNVTFLMVKFLKSEGRFHQALCMLSEVAYFEANGVRADKFYPKSGFVKQATIQEMKNLMKKSKCRKGKYKKFYYQYMQSITELFNLPNDQVKTWEMINYAFKNAKA